MPIIKDWPLLTQAIEQIIRNPKTWNQQYFGIRADCGTAYCVAGWVLELSKDKIDRFVWTDSNPLYNITPELTQVILNVGENKGLLVEPEDAARYFLGMSENVDEWELFEADNSLRDVLKTVIYWAGHDSIELPELITTTYNALPEDEDEE
jgi:hypothetical protein